MLQHVQLWLYMYNCGYTCTAVVMNCSCWYSLSLVTMNLMVSSVESAKNSKQVDSTILESCPRAKPTFKHPLRPAVSLMAPLQTLLYMSHQASKSSQATCCTDEAVLHVVHWDHLLICCKGHHMSCNYQKHKKRCKRYGDLL